jgi:OOP family OmpA-OmpF porin
MKKMTLVLCFVCLTITTFAQNTTGERILQNAKDKTYQKGEDLSNEAIDKTLNSSNTVLHFWSGQNYFE